MPWRSSAYRYATKWPFVVETLSPGSGSVVLAEVAIAHPKSAQPLVIGMSPTNQDDARDRLLRALERPFAGDELFDAVPDIVFLLKDAEGRYAAVNQTLVARTG